MHTFTKLLAAALLSASTPSASGFSAFPGVRYPVGYDPDLRTRPDYYRHPPAEVGTRVPKKWTPPLGYDPVAWKLRNQDDNADLYSETEQAATADAGSDDEERDGPNARPDARPDRKHVAEGVWVGRAIIRARENVSFNYGPGTWLP